MIAFVSVLCSIIPMIVGCGARTIKGLVPAEGVVLYQEKPLPWASLSFLPISGTDGSLRMSSAMTDENGSFQIHTQGNPGIFPGEYSVTVEKFIPNEGKNDLSEWQKQRNDPNFKESRPEETLNVISAIPLKYSNIKKSGLRITILAEGNMDLTITIK